MIDEPFRVIVLCVATKVYAPLANRDFYKKKPDTRLDTHCIKTGVQLCVITTALIQFNFPSAFEPTGFINGFI